MDPSQANDRYLASAFVYKSQMFAGGGGGGGLWINMGRWWYSWDDKFGWWEEVPIKLPQEVFSVYKSEVIVIGGESDLFGSRDI